MRRILNLMNKKDPGKNKGMSKGSNKKQDSNKKQEQFIWLKIYTKFIRPFMNNILRDEKTK